MNTNTLIDVVAMLDTRIELLEKVGTLYLNKKIWRKHEEHKARANELRMFSNQLQKAIEADVAAMESNTGE